MSTVYPVMKINMAGSTVVGECFTIGSVVVCKTCYDQVIEGEVQAFDPQTKMLILKGLSSSGKSHLNDINCVNLSLVSDVQVKKEGTTIPDPPQSLNLQRLNTRVRNQVDEKRRLVSAMSAGVSSEGQRLFIAIAKTIKEVSWRGADIVVWQNAVTISPPYSVNDVHGNENSKEFIYIKKVVEKYFKDQAATGMTNSTNVTSNNTANIVGQQTQ